jgi:hypothetical protein
MDRVFNEFFNECKKTTTEKSGMPPTVKKKMYLEPRSLSGFTKNVLIWI